MTRAPSFRVFFIVAALSWLALPLITPGLSPGQAAEGGPPAALVELAAVTEDSVETRVTFTGNAEPFRHITVASRIEELVLVCEVEEGDPVKKGQVLARLDSSRIELQLSEAKAALREGEALVLQLERDLVRKRKLYESRSISLNALEDAVTDLDRQRAVVDRSRERIRLLEAELADTVVRAPLDGVVVKRLVNQGEWVRKGGPVVELSVMDPLKAVFRVPERYLPRLQEGDPAEITADARPGRTYQGKIQAIIPMGDLKSRTFPVQVLVPNPGGGLKPGMFLRASFSAGGSHRATLLPKDAVVLSGQGYRVFKVEDGRAVPVVIDIVSYHGGLVEVVGGGLKAGDQVVVTGNERLRPGQPVEIAGSARRVDRSAPEGRGGP